MDETGAAVIRGKLGSGRGALVGIMNEIGRWFYEKSETYVEVVGFGVSEIYFPDRAVIPKLSAKLDWPSGT